MIDNNLITIAAVTAGTLVTAALKVWSDRQATKLAVRRHEWEVKDREKQNDKVLDAIADNTKISADAFEAGNNFNQKLLKIDQKLSAVIPDSETVITQMMAVSANVSQADIASVLVELQRNAQVQERYAHENVHRINNILARIQAAMLKAAMDAKAAIEAKAEAHAAEPDTK